MPTLSVDRYNQQGWGMRALIAVLLCLALATAGLTTTAGQADAATDTNPSFEIIASDLEHILKQIKISERHADGEELLCEDPLDESGLCVPDPRLPWGLRTVDGSYNNLLEGQEHFGSADQDFRRLLPIQLRPGEPIPFGAPGGAPGTPTHYNQTGGFVYDSQPRTISNLIVDLTADNPAAVAVAAEVEGSESFDHDEDPATADRIFIPNEAPDEGLSAPFNTFMTFFGQFFDHGLDLVNKGGSGTVVVPLRPEDPLYDSTSNTNFLMLTRATNKPGPDGIMGTPDDVRDHNNQTTPFVDQNQTYTSHPSHQVFLREYDANGDATGHLLDAPGAGGLATWEHVKAQALEVLGIELTDHDVVNVPLLRTDPYGNFIPGPNGFAQYATADGFVEADGGPVPEEALRTNHAFLDDIAHAAAPFTSTGGPLLRGTIDEELNALPEGQFDGDLLDDHFITGDGRGNENIALTAVHHVFHAEHNRLAGHIQDVLDANPALLDRYQNEAYAPDGLKWSYGQRLFQAARFVTEMEYQHLVFEEFGRTIQPAIDEVPQNESGYHTDIDAAIVAEFAHVVYRFGHSMLTENVHREGFETEDMPLLDAFLNPRAFTDGGRLTPDQAAGTLVTGAAANPGSGIDEFVTDTLRNELLGLPLDLATINMMRGRDTGVPPLQVARQTFFDWTGDFDLRPYDDWTDFGHAMKHEESLPNFVAAYGTHPSVVGAGTPAAKRAAAMAIVYGADGPDGLPGTEDDATVDVPGDAEAFMTMPAADSGVNDIDFWMGGLAEAGIPFGGMLGTTFNYVFETQMENLQFGDRFYYLSRNIGLNLFHQLEANSFAGIIRRTTDATLVPAEVFQTPDAVFDLNNPDVAAWAALGMTQHPTTGQWRYVGDLHVHVHGTPGNDNVRSGIGDDHLWGYDGDDDLIGGAGANAIVGGPGRDVLYGLAGEDNIKGGAGNDAIDGGSGEDLLLGGSGKDFIVHGSDPTTDFAGTGDDFVLGGPAHDIITGNEGDDWLEGASGSDLVQGDNANGFQDDPNGGHDVLNGGPGNDDMDAEGGDDIMISSAGSDRFEGMLGFDWTTHKGETVGANADMDNTVFQPPAQNNFRDRYDLVEGLSGWDHNDILRGVGRSDENDGVGHELTSEHLDRIIGLRALLGCPETGPATAESCDHAAPFMTANTTNNIILGGAGSDLIEGRGGDDFIDGAAWLDVYLRVGDQRYENLSQLRAAVFARTIDPGDIEIVREIVTAEEPEGTLNTAVFSDLLENYSVFDNGDGTLRVVHNVDGNLSDGTDTLRNVQRLQFADQTVDAAEVTGGPPPTNTPATGTVSLSDPTPREGRELTASSEIVDPDGVNQATLVYNWEMETADGWITVVTPPTGPNLSLFTPDDPEVGRSLRVVVTFEDGEGVLESLTSEPTAPVENVNDAPSGQPVLSTASPTIGTELAASTSEIVDPDGLAGATFSFQWQQNNVNGGGGFANIAGATEASFTPTTAQTGRRLRVVVSYIDDHGTTESVISEPSERVVGSAVASLPATTDFGTRRLGQARTQNVRLVNTGAGPLVIGGVTAAAPFTATSGNCPASLPAGRQCNLSVTFTANAVGPVSRTLTLTSNATNSPTTVTLTGAGRN